MLDDPTASRSLNVTIWNEYRHERQPGPVRELYHEGIHHELASCVTDELGPSVAVRTATLDEDEHGLSVEVLEETDVLVWWGHLAHGEVEDAVVERVCARVLEGMGFVALHSAHASKPFIRLMGTSCTLLYRDDELPEPVVDRELIWTVAPAHPVAAGIPHPLVLEEHEMYGEFFDIPQPDELVFVSSYTGGEVFRSGCAFLRGKGRVFYFSVGHELFPVFRNPHVRKVIGNAVRWAHSPHPSHANIGEFLPKAPGWYE